MNTHKRGSLSAMKDKSLSKPGNIALLSQYKVWILAAFLVLVFVSGGSAREDAPLLIVLRPLSVIFFCYSILTFKLSLLRKLEGPFLVVILTNVLVVAHLIPLPPSIWQNLPGRQIIVQALMLSGNEGVWLPLAMVPHEAWNSFFSMFTPTAVFLCMITLTDKDDYLLVKILIALAMFSVVLGIVQASGWSIELYPVNSIMSGLFANRNHQAALIALLIPAVALAVTWDGGLPLNKNSSKIIASGFILMLFILLMITGSRMGFVLGLIGLGAIKFVAPNFLLFQNKKPSKFRFLVNLSILSTVFVGLVYSVTLMSRNLVGSRFASGTNDARFPVWDKALEMTQTFFPWGSGVGSYVEVYQIYEPLSQLSPAYSNHVHNDWLEIALTTGLPGVIIVMLFIGIFIKSAIVSFRDDPRANQTRRLGVIMIAILAIASTADYPLRTPILAAVFAMGAAWAVRPTVSITNDNLR